MVSGVPELHKNVQQPQNSLSMQVSTASPTVSTTPPEPRNPYKCKWNILFDKTAQWISFKPTLGHTVYPCYACRDMFGSRNSFIDHTNRRGILLKYKCDPCKTNLTFYNPCSLLLHAREHFSNHEGEIDLDNLEVFSLPFGLGGFLPEADIPILYDVVENEDGRKTPINTRFYSPMEETLGRNKARLIANELVFQYNSPPNDISLIIKQISSHIPRCEFVAFKPIIATTTITTTTNSVTAKPAEKEVKVKEEKEVKKPTGLTRKCPECGEEQKSLLKHFVKDNKPFDAMLKCYECNYVAPSRCSIKAHKRLHKGSPPFICPECGKEFDGGELLRHHVDTVCFHLAKQVRFRCPGRKCGKIFAQNFTYAAHFPAHIQRLYSCELCRCTFATEPEFYTHSEAQHSVEKRPIIYHKCTVCHDDGKVYTEDNYRTHAAAHVADRAQCFYVYSCKVCHKHFRSTTTYVAHAQRCDTRTLLPSAPKKIQFVYKVGELCVSCGAPAKSSEALCLRCKSNSKLIPANTLMKVEILKERNGMRCLLCKHTLGINNVTKHFDEKQCKYANPVVVLNSDLNSTEVVRKKRKRSSFPIRKKIVHLEAKIDLEEPKEFDGVYRCKLCEFKNENRKEFHEHVVTHRYVSTAYQCMECGECFVVKPSLIKHLKYFHQVVDCDKYFQENDCFDQEAVKELESTLIKGPEEMLEPVDENQCRVCRKYFEDVTEMTKHLRTHGMAFLMNTKSDATN